MASEACCAAGAPLEQKYEPRGVVERVGDDLDVYFVGDAASTRAIVVGYDIFGFDVPQSRENCDRLADAGYRVAMPDHFRGKPWSHDRMGDEDKPALYEWIGTAGSHEVFAADVAAVRAVLAAGGARTFGYVGTCLGGLHAVRFAADAASWACAASVHGAMLSAELAEAVRVPVLVAPGSTDPPVDEMRAVLETRDFGGKCVYRQMGLPHGYYAARGDRSDPEVRAACDETTAFLVDFCNANMPE